MLVMPPPNRDITDLCGSETGQLRGPLDRCPEEILVAGETNRLVAELTFVRINDLAVPVERMNALLDRWPGL